MLHLRPIDPVTLPRTDRPLRQAAVFLGITYLLALAIALALPHAGIAPLISIAVPVVAVGLTIAICVPHGQRRAEWAAVVSGSRLAQRLVLLGAPLALAVLEVFHPPPLPVGTLAFFCFFLAAARMEFASDAASSPRRLPILD